MRNPVAIIPSFDELVLRVERTLDSIEALEVQARIHRVEAIVASQDYRALRGPRKESYGIPNKRR